MIQRIIIQRSCLCAVLILTALGATPSTPTASSAPAATPAAFLRLAPLPAPKITSAATEYPGGRYAAANLLDGDPRTEYATDNQGTRTFVEFDFDKPVTIAAFRHQDRNDVATIAASELIFFDAAGKKLAALPVRHVNHRAGVTLATLPQPLQARRVRWHVTQPGAGHGTVGGAGIVFYTVAQREPAPSQIGLDARALSLIPRSQGAPSQPLRVTLDYPYANPIEATLRVEGLPPQPVKLAFGQQTLDLSIPLLEQPRPLRLAIERAGQTLASRDITLQPARKTTVYVLPHSHTDIGYTALQTEIEDKQVNNLLLGIEAARRTASYPPGARFVWNVEVLWAADLYLNRLGEAQRTLFRDALQRGQISLCGMYLNELTGLCRPEELMRLFRYATQLREQTGATIDSAMISDVPGYTWGTVTAMSQAGIKYFSAAPNYFDRIGDIIVQWENKPFYWVGPSEKDKVLVWVPAKGYALSHIIHELSPEFVEQFQDQLDQTAYPYDIAYIRWSGHGDNATPDPAICDFIKDWSAKYEWPKFVISSTGEAFGAFEKKYGDKLPRYRGDWTPYWEDGAGSSALETAQNRASSDRLIQAEALFAMQRRAPWPAADFEAAWRNVLLYSEHTWGASCSVTDPSRLEAREQWAIKSSYATSADRQSRDLLSRGLGQAQQAGDESAIDVFNTTSWPRTDLVLVPQYLAEGAKSVIDDQGHPFPAQRLRGGQLAFIARDVPPLAARRYRLSPDPSPAVEAPVKASGATITNGLLSLRIDAKTGGITELRARGLETNLAETSAGQALNDYLYFTSDDVSKVQHSGPVKITVRERGPLVASLLIESDAPGCNKLSREVRLVAGRDSAELINIVDKRRILADSYKSPEGKESLNFAFPFHVPGGQVRLDVPFGLMRPGADQIPSSCKNWFTAGRWADVSNADFGVTWVTLDAPLVQVGGLTANLLNSQTNPDVWRKTVAPTQALYSWAMNNHWGTNYRAWQEGPVAFRFILRPHGKLDPAEASRLAIGLSQPLLAAGARGAAPATAPLLKLDAANILITGLKPSDDGKAVIVRLWEAAGRATPVKLEWPALKPRALAISDLSEKPLSPATNAVTLPAWGLVTIRAEIAP